MKVLKKRHLMVNSLRLLSFTIYFTPCWKGWSFLKLDKYGYQEHLFVSIKDLKKITRSELKIKELRSFLVKHGATIMEYEAQAKGKRKRKIEVVSWDFRSYFPSVPSPIIIKLKFRDRLRLWLGL
jgi:hypothetical protein